METLKSLHKLTFLLVLVGALNWALVGLFDFNLVTFLFGSVPMLVTIVYILVGLSALSELAIHQHICKVCAEMKANKAE